MDRTRRLRQTAVMRSMVRENHVRTEELIYPLFVMEGENIVQPVESMPGICQYSVDRMNEELDRVKALQIPAILNLEGPGADVCARPFWFRARWVARSRAPKRRSEPPKGLGMCPTDNGKTSVYSRGPAKLYTSKPIGLKMRRPGGPSTAEMRRRKVRRPLEVYNFLRRVEYPPWRP